MIQKITESYTEYDIFNDVEYPKGKTTTKIKFLGIPLFSKSHKYTNILKSKSKKSNKPKPVTGFKKN